MRKKIDSNTSFKPDKRLNERVPDSHPQHKGGLPVKPAEKATEPPKAQEEE